MEDHDYDNSAALAAWEGYLANRVQYDNNSEAVATKIPET